MIAARNVLTERSIGGATTKHAYWGLEVYSSGEIGVVNIYLIQNGSRMWVGE